MRFLKAQNLNKYRRTDQTVSYDRFGQINLKTTLSLLLPVGTTGQEPASPVNGEIRYNNSTNEIEAYSNNAWRALRYKEPTQITIQALATGDYATTVFGPLTPTSQSNYPNSNGITVYGVNYGANIMVYVENVFQIFGVNYTVVQNPVGFANGWYLSFVEAPPTKPITVIYGFDN
jgi:hypothetical protein